MMIKGGCLCGAVRYTAEADPTHCGSSISEESGTRPGMIILNVGTFDDPTVAKPGREIFRDDELPWVEVQGEIPRFAKRPD